MVGPIRDAHLGRYELIARLATGGMGEIFLARLEGAAGFEKLYAIKRILPHLARDARFRAMMIDEARITSRLSHPSICQVYELGETGGDLFIVMEYLEGLTLMPLMVHSARQGHRLPLGMIAGIAQQVTEALHYAHELRDRDGTPYNLIHRDVSPSNILVTLGGVAKVLDFGIAKAKNLSTETQTGTVKGKHAYMAPEQLRGQTFDRGVDIYAVGVLLYEMASLHRLFQRQTDYLTLQAVMELPVPDIRALRADVPPALAYAIHRALHRDRSQRFETVRQLGEAVVAAVAEVERPWSAGQLGEELASRFARELARRSQALSAAVTAAAAPARRAPSVIDDELDDAGEDSDELPEVDPALGPAPALGAFAASASPASLERGPASLERGLSELPDRRHSRAWLWPVAALAVLAVGGGGLALWQRRAPEQAVLVLERQPPTPAAGTGAIAPNGPNGPAGQVAPDGPAGQVGAREAGTTTAPLGDAGPAEPGSKRRDPKSVLQAKIAALRPKLDECLRQHPVTAEVDGKLEVRIEESGEVADVRMRPAALAQTELAGCIERVFRAQRFPKQREALAISLSVSTRVR